MSGIREEIIQPNDNLGAGVDPLETEVDPAIVAAEAKRARTFRRWIVGIFLCVLAVVVLRLVWGFAADWRLEAEIERIRASGEPLLLEEFRPSAHIKPEENAAAFYSRAAVSLSGGKSRIDFRSFLQHSRDVCASFPEDTRIILEANQEPLQLIRQARGMPSVDWGIRLSGGLYGAYPRHLSTLPNLLNLVSVSIRHHHTMHNDDEAIESLMDILGMIGHCDQPGASLVVSHCCMALRTRIVCDVLHDILPTLQVCNDRTENSKIPRCARRAQIRLLMGELLNDSHMKVHWAEATSIERALTYHAFTQTLAGGRSVGRGPTAVSAADPIPTILMHPLWKTDAIRVLRYTTSYREAGNAASWSEAQAIAMDSSDIVQRNTGFFRKMPRLTSYTMMAPLEGSLPHHYHALALRRMAAVALAIRLWEVDHKRLPENLSVLVPEYLESLPEDPFGAGGQTFAYQSDGPSPCLYSLSENGVDDHGQFQYRNGSISLDSLDLPFPLTDVRSRPKLSLVPHPNNLKYQITENEG